MGIRRRTQRWLIPLFFTLILRISNKKDCLAFPFASRKGRIDRTAHYHQQAHRARGPPPSTINEGELERELLSISFLSFLHGASIPISDVVNGAFLSKLDANSLGAIGVARSSHNSVSRLYNSPLSKTTISWIASTSSISKKSRDESKNTQHLSPREAISGAVSAALLLALFVGLFQMLIFALCASPILHGTGIASTTGMYKPALAHMKARALSCPPAVIWMVTTNIFRGLGDASTPLYCAMIFNVLNWIGNRVLVQGRGLMLIGSPIAASVAQTVSLVPMLLMLNRKVPIALKNSRKSLGMYVRTYGRASLFLCGRVMARVAAHAYCARRSALLGSVTASSYSILGQIGFWVTIASEGLSIGTQSLLSRYIVDDSATGTLSSKCVMNRARRFGLLLAMSMVSILLVFRLPIISLFTKSNEIMAECLSVYPFFLLSQLTKGLAFPTNGILLGGRDWGIAMWSMVCANVMCLGVLQLLGKSSGGLWLAWMFYYLTQGVVGSLRIQSGSGIWDKFNYNSR